MEMGTLEVSLKNDLELQIPKNKKVELQIPPSQVSIV
jgi:hypothetical protein